MANTLTAQQLIYLKSSNQRFRASVAVFPEYNPTITAPTPGAGTLLAPKPMPLVSPRYSVVDNSGTIVLHATDSYNRGGAYVGNANVSWANTGGAGTLIDNGDGTADWTAPVGGSGTNLITMTASNGNGSSAALAYVAYPKNAYDDQVAEVSSISGSVSRHGWKMTFKVRGDTTDFALGKFVLMHVDDTWDGTQTTFGWFDKYPEGTFAGYITRMQYFEDWSGQTWLGIEAVSSWVKLENMRIGETYWGRSQLQGRFYISDFTPSDALWHLLSVLTDFASRHNVTLFQDTNTIDDFIIGRGEDDRVTLASIVDDVMKRSLAIAWTDKYSSLLCIPDPDVRASEWWGTPSPIFDSTAAGPLTEEYVMDYTITYNEVPTVSKLTLEAFDSSKMGIWAISQATANALGSDEKIGGLLCDDALKLVSWAADKRGQMNRDWQIDVTMPLNHVLDLTRHVDVNFTAPSQAGGLTASGQTWIDSISYTPTMGDGGWKGRVSLLRKMEGVTADGDISGWGGSGQYGNPGLISGIDLDNAGGWTAPTQGPTTFCHEFDFVNSGAQSWVISTGFKDNVAGGEYVAGVGFSAKTVYELNQLESAAYIYITRNTPARTITGAKWYFDGANPASVNNPLVIFDQDGNILVQNPAGVGAASAAWEGSRSITLHGIFINNTNQGTNPPSAGSVIKSAIICGLGADPFGG